MLVQLLAEVAADNFFQAADCLTESKVPAAVVHADAVLLHQLP